MYIDFIKELESANRITIFSHINVDGDGVGSALALFAFIKSLNKQVGVFIDSVLPGHVQKIRGIENINKDCVLNGDLAIVVDCNDKDRIGRKKFTLKKFKKIINIDHHQDNTNFGHINIVKPGYSSTCELVYDILSESKLEIGCDVATYLIVGILTDTGNLSYDSTSSSTFRKVATLLDISNRNINYFTNMLFASNSLEIFKLKKLAYSKVEFLYNNKLAITALSFTDLKSCGVGIEDTKSIIEITYNLKPVEIVVVITEAEPDVCFVSFRSKCEIDVSKFATHFGGGGHIKASGCRIYDKLENVINRIKEVVKL